VLGDMLLKLGPIVTPAAIRSIGIPVRSVARACRFSIVECRKEFTRVLQLRHLAYSTVNKIDKDVPVAAMEDAHDEIAKIVIAQHGSRVVGSLRVVAPVPYRRHEYEELTAIPDPLQNRELLAVMSRVCTHPDYRRSDLLEALVTKGDEVARSLGKRYGIGGCTDSLLPVYKRFGWRSTGVKYNHASLNNIQEHLVYKDLQTTTAGPDKR
jgi:predicted GNAT family N-acyltransferase